MVKAPPEWETSQPLKHAVEQKEAPGEERLALRPEKKTLRSFQQVGAPQDVKELSPSDLSDVLTPGHHVPHALKTSLGP